MSQGLNIKTKKDREEAGAPEVTLTAAQQRAVDMIRTQRIGTLMGGAGTGKTTCLREATRKLDCPVWLMAPTGKAALRMEEAIGRMATTVHRGIGRLPDGTPIPPVFSFDRTTKAPPVVIVDEASMLDTRLAAALFESIPSEAALFFVGDPHQLPSVGPGCVFRDLYDVPSTVLDVVQRAAAESWMCREAAKIAWGTLPNLEDTESGDFQWYRDAHAAAAVVGYAQQFYAEGDDFQVIVATHRGPLGREALNRALRTERLRHRTPTFEWHRPKCQGDVETLYEGDPVVQTRNDYTLGVMNGEIGIVTEKRRDHPMVVDGRMQRQDVVMVHFGDRAVPYPILASYGLQLAYAITAHKSQGSEWMHTAVAFDDSAGPLLSREWLYTAVTRAKDSLLLVAPERAIRRAMGRSVLAERQTGLAMRIQEAIA